jgi:RNA polymerase sigma factor (sigma-70 family)
MNNVVRYLRRVTFLAGGDAATDAQLLEAFVTLHDEAAFEALLRRHAAMVLGVCRRVLRNPCDAEDAFQATFLVLVRKAETIRPRALVGNWLYGVACRTARKALAMNQRRQVKERAAPPAGASNGAAGNDQTELLEFLDTELSRLPDKYRVPLVLCELEGKSRKTAAQLLGLPEGTLSWRLAWARKLLARRLSRRGVTFSAGALAAVLANSACASASPLLLNTTCAAALQVAAGRAVTAGTVSAQVLTLTEGVLKAMLLSKLKVVWIVLLAVAIGVGATGLTYRAVADEPQQYTDAPRRARVASDELDELRLEIEALRRGLQATRERVKLLENEVQTLRHQAAAPAGMGSGIGMMGGTSNNFSRAQGTTTSSTSGIMSGSGTTTGAPGMKGGGTSSSSGSGGGMMMSGMMGASGMKGGGITSSSTMSGNMMTGMGGASGLGGGKAGGAGMGNMRMSGGGSSAQGAGGGKGGATGSSAPANAGQQGTTGSGVRQHSPLAQAESALRVLREQPDNQKALDSLERALREMKEQSGSKGPAAK